MLVEDRRPLTGRPRQSHSIGGAPGEPAGREKDLAGLFSSYTANDPQFSSDSSSHEKAKSLHVPLLQQTTDALGVYMGSAYVNDFNFNNRSYRVYVQADRREIRTSANDVSSTCAPTAEP